MVTVKLYIATTIGQILSANGAAGVPVDPNTLPLYFGDTIPLDVYLLEPLADPPPSTFPWSTMSTVGLQLFCFIDDGKINGTIYTQLIEWDTDPDNTYFSGELSLNTQAIEDAIGTGTSMSAWLKFGYIQNGYQHCVFSKQITIGVGMPLVNLVVPANQTPLSLEVARATFLSQQPVAGRPIILMSPAGKLIQIVAVDNPDGSASIQENNLN